MTRQRLLVIALTLAALVLALPRVFAAMDSHGFVRVKPDELK